MSETLKSVAADKAPMVSVIVPNYNHEAYLAQRLQTILLQTFTDFELIILDDHSSDNSRQIIEAYRTHPQVSKIVFNDKNSGSPFKQWRMGLELARGKWIWIAESDDFCKENLLQTLLEQATKNASIVLSYCQSEEVNEHGDGWRTMRWHTDKVDKEYWKTDYVTAGKSEIAKSLWYINSIPNASAVIFKKDAYLKADKQFEQMKMCGDWMLWMEILKQGSISFCATPLNFFRNHTATTRVLDSCEKQRRLAEEEYKVITKAASLVALPFFPLRRRLWRLLKNYAALYSSKELLQFIRLPASYNKPVPLFTLASIYFARLAYVRTKRLFAR